MNQRLLLALPTLAVLSLSTLTGCANDDGSDMSSAPNGPRDRLHGRRQQGGGRPDGFENAKKDPSVQPSTTYAAAGWAEEVNQLPKAAELYRQTLKGDPKHQQAMYRLGVVTAKLRQFPESIEVWKRYVKLTNESAEALSNLAYTYELAGLPADAEAAYQRGIDREPGNLPCRTNYGVLLAKQGKANEALIQLQAVLSPAEAHYNLGSVYELQGKKDQARAEYTKALELDKDLYDAQTRLSALPQD
jgi:tetratricopeptide (TPR) repeat protein